ncbi:hypothetical protein DAPPUDRAFT_248758 [Daphnia pulex]|uniref:Uncharacterized protein n=1 Tax=Daphnia pulex TaxID=6669 RepID=E9GV55_DAPPU|nr:hypothetical protein DAPPUDRAFT_248758 [Daphnia pulex]|eukprot:EFX76601.1 hypothetical protein DAPPUDRAFT_248758 [Daphnia pulex]
MILEHETYLEPVAIQAAIGGNIIARESISPLLETSRIDRKCEMKECATCHNDFGGLVKSFCINSMADWPVLDNRLRR